MAVELKAEVWAELDGTDAKVVARFIGYGAVGAQQLGLDGIEMRGVEVPKLGVGYFHIGGDALFLMTGHLVALQGHSILIDVFARG